MAAIFISYAREDTERARAVRDALSERYSVSMDCDVEDGATAPSDATAPTDARATR